MKVVVDGTVHSEHGTLISCDFKQGSIERSIDLDKRGCTSASHITNKN
jgi:hypothetical protein